MGTIYTIQEAADKLRVDHRIIRREIKNGRLAAAKIGDYRISEEDLNEFFEQAKKGHPKKVKSTTHA